MSKTILVVPYEQVQNVRLDPPAQRVILVTGGGEVGAREAFQKLARGPERESCVLFVAPPSAAEAIARVFGPTSKESPARLDLSPFETWREVAETAFSKIDRSTGKTLILIPVPAQGDRDLFARDVAQELVERGIVPDVICRPSRLGDGDLCGAISRGRRAQGGEIYAPTLRLVSFPLCEGTGADDTSRYWDAAEALDNLSEALAGNPDACSVAVAMETPLAEWVQRHLLPRSQHGETPVREGTLAVVLQLPMDQWSELDPQALWDRPAERKARVLHVFAKPQAQVITPAVVPPPIFRAPRVGPDVEKRVVFITPAAWAGNAKAREARGSFNTNCPKGALTAEGVRALTEVFQHLEDQELRPELILSSTAADATWTAERVRKMWRRGSGELDLERLPALLPNNKALSSAFEVLTRPQNADVTTVFVIAAQADLGRLTDLMGSGQTFAPHTDVRIAQLHPGVTWADVSRFMKKRLPTAPIAACVPLS